MNAATTEETRRTLMVRFSKSTQGFPVRRTVESFQGFISEGGTIPETREHYMRGVFPTRALAQSARLALSGIHRLPAEVLD